MSRPDHILIINVFFAPHSFGGATMVAEDVAKALIADHGIKISAISAMQRKDLPPYAVMRVEADGIASYLINLPEKRSYQEMYDNPVVTDLVAGLLTQIRPDLVHAHCVQDLGGALLGMIKARGFPLVLSVHDFWWLCERQFMIKPDQTYCGQDPIQIENCVGCVPKIDRARTRFEALSKAVTSADLITFPSQFAKGLSERSGMTAGALAVWANGIKGPGPGFFDAQAARRAADPTVVMGYLGGPTQVKGWTLIKEVFEAIERTDFIGLLAEGSLNNEWWPKQNLSRMRGTWIVHPHFDRSTMDDFYAKIDVLLFPSQWKETFGLTVREALARGIPVIQTDSGGTTEWDGADPSEMLQISDGADKLHDKIEAFLDNPPSPRAPMVFPDAADQANDLLDLIARYVPLGSTSRG